MLILFLVLIQISSAIKIEEDEAKCPRLRVRTARKLFTEVFENTLKEIGSEEFSLPSDCPFNPLLDRYYQDEQNKKRLRSTQWQCGYCDKLFVAEDWLDQHFHRKHLSRRPQNATVCLADYCVMLGCDEADNIEDQTEDEYSKFEKLKQSCNPTEKAKEEFECQAVLHKCFPPQLSSISHRLHDRLTQKLCVPISCDPAIRQLRQPSKKDPTLYYVLAMLLMFGLASYYITVWLYKGEFITQKELRALKATRGSWLSKFFSKERRKLV